MYISSEEVLELLAFSGQVPRLNHSNGAISASGRGSSSPHIIRPLPLMLLASLRASALLSDPVFLLAALTALAKHLLFFQLARPPPFRPLQLIILAVGPPFVAV